MGRSSGIVTQQERIHPAFFSAVLACLVLPWNPAHLKEIRRDLTIAPESRCAAPDPGDYPYPQSVEDEVIAQRGGVAIAVTRGASAPVLAAA